MKHKTKIKIEKFLLKVVKPDVFQVLFILVILLIPLSKSVFKKEALDIMAIFDIPTFTSIVLALTAASIATTISDILNKNLEDYLKLTPDYKQLVKRYPNCNKIITYTNSSESNFEKGRKLTSIDRDNKKSSNTEDTYDFPVTLEKYCYNNKLEIIDTTNQYTLPTRIMEYYDKIMSAHKHSDIYNQLNIRLDGWGIKDNIIELHTSRTTYYDSLVTNRAMDYEWNSNITTRDIYGVGPFFKELEESELSNHLGFNGFVETSDNKVIFVKRNKNVSIGKGTIGTSIAASLKTKYALDEKGSFTIDGLIAGIKGEIRDELKIGPNCYEFSLDKNIIALYRDMVEGGKPQLLFYVKLNISYNEVQRNFLKVLEIESKNKDIVSRLNADGRELICVENDEIHKIYITPDTIVIGDKAYKMMPSASASIVMLLEFYKIREHEAKNTSY